MKTKRAKTKHYSNIMCHVPMGMPKKKVKKIRTKKVTEPIIPINDYLKLIDEGRGKL